MPMTIYKLYAATAGDSVASCDVQLDGDIMSIMMTIRAKGVDLLDEGVEAELSFLSTNTFTNSDVRGSLMTVQSQYGVLTSGGLNTAINAAISSLEVPVNAGERIHLHINDIGTLTARIAHGYLYVRDKGTQRVPGRRR